MQDAGLGTADRDVSAQRTHLMVVLPACRCLLWTAAAVSCTRGGASVLRVRLPGRAR